MNLLENKDDFGGQQSTSAELQLEFDGSAHHMNSGILAQNLNHGIGLIRVTPLPVPVGCWKRAGLAPNTWCGKRRLGWKVHEQYPKISWDFPKLVCFWTTTEALYWRKNYSLLWSPILGVWLSCWQKCDSQHLTCVNSQVTKLKKPGKVVNWKKPGGVLKLT